MIYGCVKFYQPFKCSFQIPAIIFESLVDFRGKSKQTKSYSQLISQGSSLLTKGNKRAGYNADNCTTTSNLFTVAIKSADKKQENSSHSMMSFLIPKINFTISSEKMCLCVALKA